MKVQIATSQLELWKIDEAFANLPHAHENLFQFTIPMYGTCFVTHRQKAYRLTEGQALVLHPQNEHELRLEAGSGAVIIQVDRHSWSRLYAEQPVELADRRQLDPADVKAHFRRWTQALSAIDPTERMPLQELESEVLLYLFRAWNGSRPAHVPDVRADRHLARALEYIHDNYTRTISIDSLAAIALQSRFHFIRSFKALMHLTPYQYILQLRIADAKLRLKETKGTVSEISQTLGFASASGLYRAFAKAVGMTPEQYRKS